MFAVPERGIFRVRSVKRKGPVKSLQHSAGKDIGLSTKELSTSDQYHFCLLLHTRISTPTEPEFLSFPLSLRPSGYTSASSSDMAKVESFPRPFPALHGVLGMQDFCTPSIIVLPLPQTCSPGSSNPYSSLIFFSSYDWIGYLLRTVDIRGSASFKDKNSSRNLALLFHYPLGFLLFYFWFICDIISMYVLVGNRTKPGYKDTFLPSLESRIMVVFAGESTEGVRRVEVVEAGYRIRKSATSLKSRAGLAAAPTISQRKFDFPITTPQPSNTTPHRVSVTFRSN